ncbi:hypothetical protein B1759_18115 [Rubrivirga sp. SAORIC476]|uniref:hypothetical protein n=1 Tax=Rubrivirga sp. SAORIC476 TaxID=1961794 RepID=UPI000BA91B93|nr:hypothetical protein [Rubrivirga sp. SAORIC476]PAP74343.1 hypothetical protein B1759_18115 [Rubrivirga sp. SAORIC476]
MRLVALLLLVVPALARAQVGVDLTVGPIVTWTEDVSGFQFDPTDPTQTPLDGTETFSIPASIGFEAGLGVVVMPGPVGFRVGAHFLNTSAVLDEDGNRFNRESLSASFVTLQLDARTGRRFGPLTAYAFGGPEFRFLVDLSDENVTFASAREEAQLLSTVATFGAGLTFEVGGTRIGPKVGYSLDLTGVEGGDLVLDDGTAVRFDEAYSVDTLLFGLVFGGR